MTMTEATDDSTPVCRMDNSHQDKLEEDGEKEELKRDKTSDMSDADTDNADSNKVEPTKSTAKSHQGENEGNKTKYKMTFDSNSREGATEQLAAANTPTEASFKSDLHASDTSMEPESATCMNKKQYGVFDNIKTNDSPIHAVSQLTDVNAYTVQWKPATSISYTTETSATEAQREKSIVPNSAVIAREEEIFPRQSQGYNVTEKEDRDTTNSTPPSVLELTVDKLKLSKSNGAFTSKGDEIDAAPSKVPLASSAPPDFLNEIKERAQLNRRKSQLFAKSSPPPIFRGLNARRSRPKSHKDNMPAFGKFLMNQVAVSSANLLYDGMVNGSLERSRTDTMVNEGHDSRPKSDPYVINRAPLRTIAPKSNGVAPTQPLSVSIGPITPPTSLTKSAQDLGTNNLVSPLGRPHTSSGGLLTVSVDEAMLERQVRCNQTSFDSQEEQPLDLCTKSSSSEASSAPSSPSQDIHDDNQPLNLCKVKSESSSPPPPSLNPKVHQLPPMSSSMTGMWNRKTPPRANRKSFAGTSSPLEADTASDTAANSPGLDNQKLPYSLIMSPDVINGLVGAISPTGQIIPHGYPKGAVMLPGPGPHYRLSPHMAKQHNEPPTPERPYMCDLCGATFKRNKSLKAHHRVHANEQATFQFGDNAIGSAGVTKTLLCDVCPRKFAHPEQLKRHVRGHHEDKPYICENEHCGKRFSDSSQLKLHMRTHSSHKPFPCPYCPLRFKYSGDVKRHVRIHTGEKPYVCGYCKMRFTQSNTLKQHERTHTGERPYHCHKCGMTFTQSGSLKYHLAHRHPPDIQTVIITTNSSTLTPAGSPIGSQVMIMSPPMLK